MAMQIRLVNEKRLLFLLPRMYDRYIKIPYAQPKTYTSGCTRLWLNCKPFIGQFRFRSNPQNGGLILDTLILVFVFKSGFLQDLYDFVVIK